jgi:hypothetical protein
MENLKENLSKFLLPALTTLLGLVLIGFTINQYVNTNRLYDLGQTDEPGRFAMVLGAIAITLAGLAMFVFISIKLSSNKIYKSITIGFSLVALLVGYNAYMTIKIEADKAKARKIRKEALIDRLVDLQTAQKEYKTVFGNYCTNLDTLLYFINETKSITLKKTPLKELPAELDTLSDQGLIDNGYLKIDTSYEALTYKLYESPLMKEKRNYRPFNMDSLKFVPVTPRKENGEKYTWIFQSDSIENNDIKNATFIIKDPKPLPKQDTTYIGSLIESTANGNWSDK